jgi:hypothetical protein
MAILQGDSVFLSSRLSNIQVIVQAHKKSPAFIKPDFYTI